MEQNYSNDFEFNPIEKLIVLHMLISRQSLSEHTPKLTKTLHFSSLPHEHRNSIRRIVSLYPLPSHHQLHLMPFHLGQQSFPNSYLSTPNTARPRKAHIRLIAIAQNYGLVRNYPRVFKNLSIHP